MFLITIPHTSPNFKKIYNKQFEIYEGTLDNNVFTTTKVYIQNKSSFKVKEGVKSFAYPTTTFSLSEVMQGRYYNSSPLVFNTFEEAHIAKCFLLNKLREFCLRHIASLKAKVEKDCPDVSSMLNELKDKHPEVFI